MNGNWMERRTMSKSNGFSVPGRCTFSLKLVPTCPRSISLTSWLFKQAFLDLKKRGMTSLVIDLRNNGGGLLDESIEIANFFLPRGKTLVTTKGKIKQASNTYKTLREPLDLEIPLAVLVNGGTASSSEILAGSLQDLDRAVIIGNRTFGKGLVQTTRPLPYGGTMKLTTSKYYIPSGRCVQAIDYKHRNEDGSVGRIPDSLTTVFHTAAGREVRLFHHRLEVRIIGICNFKLLC